MLHYYKFRQDLFGPVPASEAYHKPGKGRGWPEECPPIRAANAFGFDLLANFDVTFVRTRSLDRPWRAEPDIVVESDFAYAASEDSPGSPLTQQYAWFWQKGQKLPHPISDNVFEHVKHQVKLSSFLYFKTDPNELLLFGAIPNIHRPFRTMSACVDADWYPASYCWHIVLELDPSQKRIDIARGTPLCRVQIVRRDTYFAKPMSSDAFDEFFESGQRWLATHGRVHDESEPGQLDITKTYSRQQLKSKFVVLP
jgi:hypothetical protein